MTEHQRPFRFGTVADQTGDVATWRASVRQLESLGYSTVLLPDTLSTPASLPALAVAACATTRLRVGNWVLSVPAHGTNRLSWELRAMWELFGDRIEAGLGAGRLGSDGDAAALGMTYGRPAQRVAQVATTVRELRDQLPTMRVLIAASGPRLLRLAGEVADTVALGCPPATDLAAAQQLVAAVRAGAEGRSVPPELAMGLIAVGAGQHPWLARMGTDPVTLARNGSITVLTGAPGEMADQLLRRRDTLGISYVTVPAILATELAPVVELLAGR